MMKESNVSLQPPPKTMKQVIAEFFEVKPEQRPLYFRGYKPHNFYRIVSGCDTLPIKPLK